MRKKPFLPALRPRGSTGPATRSRGAAALAARVRGPATVSLPERVRRAAGLAPSGAARAAQTERPVAATAARSRPPGRPQGPPWPIVLGIDPGTIVVGYGAIEAGADGPRFLETGVVRPRARAGAPQRLGEIQVLLTLLIARIRPAIVVVERAFAARNAQSALRIGEGRGVALACATAFGAEVVEMAPAVAKKALVGHGAADKTQVAAMAAAALGLSAPPRPLDASDALALALAHVWHRVDWSRDGGGADTRRARRPFGGARGGSAPPPA